MRSGRRKSIILGGKKKKGNDAATGGGLSNILADEIGRRDCQGDEKEGMVIKSPLAHTALMLREKKGKKKG